MPMQTPMRTPMRMPMRMRTSMPIEAPIAYCYPAYSAQGFPDVGPRVAIAITMHFDTADGAFDEDLPATAWLTSLGEAPSVALAIGYGTVEEVRAVRRVSRAGAPSPTRRSG